MVKKENILEFYRKVLTPIVKQSLCEKVKCGFDDKLTEYLTHSDERLVVLNLKTNSLVGVSHLDDNYASYHVFNSVEEIGNIENDEMIVTEFEGLKHLCKFEQEDTMQFYKWGYNFSLQNGVLTVRTATMKALSIKPRAANSIEIIQTY